VKPVILLADDSATIQRLVTQMFVDVDFEIVAVSNGDAAIRKFEELRPAVVLADIYMPGKNGYEVCAYVKKHAERSTTPVILLAGAFDAFDERIATTVGATAHITKPFEPQALVNLVVSVLSKEVHAAAAEPSPVVESPVAEPSAAAASSAVASPSAAAASSAVASPSAAVESSAAAPPSAADSPAPAEPPAKAGVSAPPAAPPSKDGEAEDLLGLRELFKPSAPPLSSRTVTEEEIERIADRVIQKLSTQVIEDVAWHVVPDITTKVLREELKRQS
jgi:CheY-like chemotaxis protein